MFLSDRLLGLSISNLHFVLFSLESYVVFFLLVLKIVAYALFFLLSVFGNHFCT